MGILSAIKRDRKAEAERKAKLREDLVMIRQLAKSIAHPSAIVPYLTAEILREAGFTIGSDTDTATFATRVKAGIEVELRISKVNGTMAGTVAKREPTPHNPVNDVSLVDLAFSSAVNYPPMVNRTHHEEVSWSTLLEMI